MAARAGWLLLLSLAACGAREVQLSFPPEIIAGRPPALIVAFQAGEARLTRQAVALAAPDTSSAIQAELLDDGPLFASLLVLDQPLAALALAPGPLVPAAPGADALSLAPESAFVARLDQSAPSWSPELDLVTAAASVRIEGQPAMELPCAGVQPMVVTLPIRDQDLISLAIAPDGRAFVGGGGTDGSAALFASVSAELDAMLLTPPSPLGRIRALAISPAGIVYLASSELRMFALESGSQLTHESSGYDKLVQRDGGLIAWSETGAAELGPDLSVSRLRLDIPFDPEGVLPLLGEQLLVMTSSAVRFYDGAVWSEDLCCFPFAGKGVLFGAHGQAGAAVGAQVLLRHGPGDWRQLPALNTLSAIASATLLGGGRLLVGGAGGTLYLFDEEGWCEVDSGVNKEITALAADVGAGFYYGVTYGRLSNPAVLRGRFVPAP